MPICLTSRPGSNWGGLSRLNVRPAQSAPAVALNDDFVLLGGVRDDTRGQDAGTVYRFDISTGQQIKLYSNDIAADDRFGISLAVDGNTAIIGAHYDDDLGDRSGAAYLFDVQTGQQLRKLLPNDGAADDVFGVQVDIDGTTAVVGSYNDALGDGSGAVYLFDVATGNQTFKLVPADGAASDRFGWSVAINGNYVVVGAGGNDEVGLGAGAAYLFDATTGQQLAKFVANDTTDGDRFGDGFFGVSISGTSVIVSARNNDDQGFASGSAYIFDISNCINQPVDIAPESIAVLDGDLAAGDVSSLANSDNNDLVMRRSNTDLQSRTTFSAMAVSPTETPSAVTFTLEGSVFSRGNVVQSIDLFDYSLNTWEEIDSQDASRFGDATVVVSPTGDLTRFVQPATRRIEARIRFRGATARAAFSSNTDHVLWTITP